MTKNKSNKTDGEIVLGADKAALMDVSYSAALPVHPAASKPDNSINGLARSKKIPDSRAFLRAKGVADHLYSDDGAIAQYDKWKKLPYDKQSGELDMKPEVETHVDAPDGTVPEVVKRAEYSTVEGDLKPQYKDKEKADTPTPANPKLPV